MYMYMNKDSFLVKKFGLPSACKSPYLKGLIMAKIFCVTDIQTLNFRFFFGYLNTDKSSEGLCWYPGVVGLSVNNAVAQVLYAPVLQHPHQGDLPHHHQPAQATQEQEQVGQKNKTWKLEALICIWLGEANKEKKVSKV